MCWRSHTWLCYGWLGGVWKAGLQRSCSIPVPGTRDQTCSFRLIRQDLCHWGASPALSSIQVRSILKFLPLMYLPESMSFRALFKHSLLGAWGGWYAGNCYLPLSLSVTPLLDQHPFSQHISILQKTFCSIICACFIISLFWSWEKPFCSCICSKNEMQIYIGIYRCWIYHRSVISVSLD